MVNRLALAAVSALLVAPFLAGPAGAFHGYPSPSFVVIHKSSSGTITAAWLDSSDCTFTLLGPLDAQVTCAPVWPEYPGMCYSVWAATHHESGSLGNIAATAQCTNGVPVTAASLAPASDVQGPEFGDWDYPFTCTVHFDLNAVGSGACMEGA
ncbi:MAG TPA: hypothetical protein VHH36_00215 [Candidatus Thermoplasmatota archaeon]|nr:hypothetical protein [Candidatus Thermoplasmatota archaeon]